jgi:adenylylsulfate kinase-like enzyme
MTYPVIWLTGLPCSGKTTIAKELAKNTRIEVLDGDDIRENEDGRERGQTDSYG